jgi:hypothetical protein
MSYVVIIIHWVLTIHTFEVCCPCLSRWNSVHRWCVGLVLSDLASALPVDLLDLQGFVLSVPSVQENLYIAILFQIRHAIAYIAMAGDVAFDAQTLELSYWDFQPGMSWVCYQME